MKFGLQTTWLVNVDWSDRKIFEYANSYKPGYKYFYHLKKGNMIYVALQKA